MDKKTPPTRHEIDTFILSKIKELQTLTEKQEGEIKTLKEKLLNTQKDLQRVQRDSQNNVLGQRRLKESVRVVSEAVTTLSHRR